jgi:hypothetical protein
MWEEAEASLKRKIIEEDSREVIEEDEDLDYVDDFKLFDIIGSEKDLVSDFWSTFDDDLGKTSNFSGNEGSSSSNSHESISNPFNDDVTKIETQHDSGEIGGALVSSAPKIPRILGTMQLTHERLTFNDNYPHA